MPVTYEMCLGCGYIGLVETLCPEEWRTYYELSPTPSRDAFKLRAPTLEERRAFVSRFLGDSPCGIVIEIGPAYGDFLAGFSEFDERVGVEPSHEYCEMIRSSNVPILLRECALEQVVTHAPELQGSGDLVMACCVLEHAPDPRAFVRAMVQLAKVGGLVYIEVPAVEAFAETDNPSYQTLHPGHRSQFSAVALHWLCVSEFLAPVGAEITAKHSYPVMRAMYRVAPDADALEGLLMRHVAAVGHQALQAKERLLGHVTSRSNSQTVIWGCGQDLLDVFDLFNDAEFAGISDGVTLVDADQSKQGRTLRGLTIRAADAFEQHSVDLVLVASRSELIRADIRRAACCAFPSAHVLNLYEG